MQNGFGGLAAALEGIGTYLDPNATYFIREGKNIADQTSSMLWVQAIALILSIVIGCMTFTGSMIAVFKLHGTIASKPRIIPYRTLCTCLMFAAIVILSAFSFSGGQTWNDRQEGLAFIVLVAAISCLWGIIAVMAIGGGDMPVSISFLNSLSGFSTSFAGFMLVNKALVVSGGEEKYNTCIFCCEAIQLLIDIFEFLVYHSFCWMQRHHTDDRHVSGYESKHQKRDVRRIW